MSDVIRLEFTLKQKHRLEFDLDNPEALRELAELVKPYWYEDGQYFEGTDEEWDDLVDADKAPKPTKDQVFELFLSAVHAGFAYDEFSDGLVEAADDTNWVNCDPGEVAVSWDRNGDGE